MLFLASVGLDSLVTSLHGPHHLVFLFQLQSSGTLGSSGGSLVSHACPSCSPLGTLGRVGGAWYPVPVLGRPDLPR